MTEPCEAVRKVQDGLEPYIKPREQVNYIRRILALHLHSFNQDARQNQPLPLAASSHDVVQPAPDTKGLYLEYYEALKANAAARQQLEGVSQGRPQTPEQQTTEPESGGVNHLEEHLTILKLEQKRQKLSTVRKYLDHLVDQPAASPNFLHADEIFGDSTKLPSVPKQIVDSLVVQGSGQSSDLKSRANQLEKMVLRAKLRLRQEEKLLADAKARSRSRSDVVSNGVRLEALNATRTELIDWIETELSMASGDDPAPESKPSSDEHGNIEEDQAAITSNLSEIKEKYAHYLELRKDILKLVSSAPAVSSKPDLTPSNETSAPEQAPPPPANHLLVPYIENLLALSRAQRSTIAQKSHISTRLSAQLKETCQALGHLAEESQLLPAYPMKESLRRRSGLVSELTSKKSGVPDIANRIKPWVFASDAAKITSLEAVAETIEGGQLSLEESMKALDELENLLGLIQYENKEAEDEGATEEDVWLDAQDSKEKAGSRKHTTKPSGQISGDIWSTLHGNLGLLGQEDSL